MKLSRVFLPWIEQVTPCRHIETFNCRLKPSNRNAKSPLLHGGTSDTPVIFHPASLSAQTSWGISKALNVGGEGGWDYLRYTSALRYGEINSQVIDTETGTMLADIPGAKVKTGTFSILVLKRL